ncbi:hypothetical protein SUGI_0071990 [Cryptomeria japonica]|nr:hypothetical protein SUGI_0071990 [Cryptomeria japonica]
MLPLSALPLLNFVLAWHFIAKSAISLELEISSCGIEVYKKICYFFQQAFQHTVATNILRLLAVNIKSTLQERGRAQSQK